MKSFFPFLTLTTLCLVSAATAISADLPAGEAEEGFVCLFNGKDLDGWQGAVQGYTVEDGAIVCRKGGNLYTAKPYSNFILRLEFKVPPGGNNGLGIRSGVQGNPAYSAMELQVLDNEAPCYKNLKPYQYHGSVYGVAPAKRGFLRPAGEWNSQEVRAEGSHIQVILNGHTIVDTDLAKIEKPYMDGNEHPGLLNESGHIGFLGHGSPVAFRAIRIKELK